ncbi:MAG TPA: allantoinase AllB, partial [Pirellulales bacterium]|nr:allantoinase AllB [Pirellulales bacterium]
PENVERVDELADCGVVGFKAFMCASGIDDFTAADDFTLWQGMQVAARLGLPVAVHAENDALTQGLASAAIKAGRRGARDFLASRPVIAELEAIEHAIRLADEAHCSLHIVHVSCGAGVALVVEARKRGADVTCETCPHYLVLSAEDVERLGAVAKCAPPLRTREEQESLWRSLEHGDIELIASDHSPSPPSMKQGDDFFAVWGGIAGCQTTLGLLLEEGVERRGLPLAQIVNLVTRRPAQRFGLTQKGRLEVGADADLALVDMSRSTMLAEDALRYRHRISPYLGRRLRGEVRRTIVRGRTIYGEGSTTPVPTGRLVRPSPRSTTKPGAAV